ncbi:neuroguidin [Hypanus sabinus]|uniref:neuroguidin n=1 Tax=Hypanus sabinus TaxID=79690 RepID=UPI0028C393A9|nr:neuroguidin [Hypanus sabinus]
MAAAAAALKALGAEVSAVTAHTRNVLRGMADTPSSQGLTFLQVKNQLLAAYLSDLAYVILHKVTGHSLRGEPALLRLVEHRTVLEKMRPIEQKLRYQIDKLVKTALTGTLGAGNPLNFKPNPGNLISRLDDEEERDVEDEEGDEEEEAETPQKKESVRSSKKVYVPPRLVPMVYDGDETAAERENRQRERARRRALSNSLIRELQEEYSQAPEELREGHGYHSMHQHREQAHRVQYEEAMMVRLNVPRSEKRRRQSRSLAMSSQLSSLTHFGSIAALTGETESEPVRKKQRVTARTKKKKQRGFRRR